MAPFDDKNMAKSTKQIYLQTILFFLKYVAKFAPDHRWPRHVRVSVCAVCTPVFVCAVCIRVSACGVRVSACECDT